MVYLSRSGKHVIKVPICYRGQYANEQEARDYRDGSFLGRSRLARCREAKLDGQWVLVMERVEPANGVLPEWTDFVDCRQVGYNRKGNLVAYDWATDKF